MNSQTIHLGRLSNTLTKSSQSFFNSDYYYNGGKGKGKGGSKDGNSGYMVKNSNKGGSKGNGGGYIDEYVNTQNYIHSDFAHETYIFVPFFHNFFVAITIWMTHITSKCNCG